jgi:ferrochelatase
MLNMGGPDSLDAVRPFLYNLFSDRFIIQLGPPFLQKPLAWFISTIRSKKTASMYSKIGGKSPIIDITTDQAKALEYLLNNSNADASQISYRTYIGMRYWNPFIEDTLRTIHSDGISKLIGLSMYPHYSVTTSGSTLNKLKQVASGYPFNLTTIESWYDNPSYIEALADIITEGIKSFSKTNMPTARADVHVLFSAHSLPQKIIDQGDPYVEHIHRTIEEVSKKIQITWHLSYQSKAGPVKWLEPSTEEKLLELSKKGVKNLLMVPISFISDHIETLYEIDILYQDICARCGLNLIRTESLNTNPLFIRALKNIIVDHQQKAGWD